MIVRLTGGIGNQLFMYAFGRSVAAITDAPLKFHWCRSTWDYALDPFRLSLRFEEPKNIPVYDESSFAFDPKVYHIDEGSYFRGYWQTEKYFRPALLLKDFDWWLNYPGGLRATIPQNFVSIHVRRGDYLKPGTKEFHGVLSESYYQEAIAYMKTQIDNPTFVVFTDDSDMKEFLGHPVASSKAPHLDLWTMANFSHHILANSTFSWWGAWFSEHTAIKKQQNIVAPKQWFTNPEINTKDLIPSRWIRL